MELRPYQQELVENLRRGMASGKRSLCAVLGCGGGKSVIAAEIARAANEKGSRVLFLVHRAELCSQIAAAFDRCGVNPALTDIRMVQSASARTASMEPPQLILTDEAHHCLASFQFAPLREGQLSKSRILL